MGEPARQPIRVYASSESAATAADRAALLLAEIDRTGALDRSVFALFSPTGSGYVNYVATETLEYLTRGDCASAAIQYSVLPSALSLGKVHDGDHPDADRDERHRAAPAGDPAGAPPEVLSVRGKPGLAGQPGDCSRVRDLTGPSRDRPGRCAVDRHTGGHRVARPDHRGHGHHPDTDRATRRRVRHPMPADWTDLDENDRAAVRFLLLQNGDDPIPKFAAPLLWRRPDWLGPDRHATARRPAGHPVAAGDHLLHHLHRHAERPHPDPRRVRRGRPRLPPGHPGGAADGVLATGHRRRR